MSAYTIHTPMVRLKGGLLLLLAAMPFFSLAQQWQPFHLDDLAVFGDAQGLQLSLESNLSTGWAASSYKVDRGPVPFFNDRVVRNQDHWIGQKVILDTVNHQASLIAHAGDTLHLRYGLPPGQSYTAMRGFSGNNIEATVLSVSQGSVLGVPDSIKTFGLTVFNNGLPDTANPLTGSTLSISKDHGLLESIPFLHFPASTPIFAACDSVSNLSGLKKADNWEGIPWPDLEDIYGYLPGDQFHRVNKLNYAGLGGGSTRRSDIEWIYNLEQGPNGDSLVGARCRQRISYSYQAGTDTTHEYQALGLAVPQGELSLPGVLYAKTPDVLCFLHRTLDSSFVTVGRPVLYAEAEDYYFPLANDSCWNISQFGHPGNIFNLRISYGMGLGLINEESSNDYSNFSSNLVYFQNKNGSWGSPLNEYDICEIIIVDPPTPGISIYPSPFRDHLNILAELSDSTDVEITMFDIQGRLIFSGILSNLPLGSSQRIDTQKLSPGIYIVQVVWGEEISTFTIFKDQF